MKTHFKKTGWIYVPVSLAGWIVTILYVAISVFTLVVVDKTYNNLTNSLIRFFPYFISLSVLYFWVASNNTSKKAD
jgi:ABC-type bacteriocin/lantibiotic exporter with double-glycine peptidase domain